MPLCPAALSSLAPGALRRAKPVLTRRTQLQAVFVSYAHVPVYEASPLTQGIVYSPHVAVFPMPAKHRTLPLTVFAVLAIHSAGL